MTDPARAVERTYLVLTLLTTLARRENAPSDPILADTDIAVEPGGAA